MAYELQYNDASLTGSTLYVVVWDAAGQAWNGSAFATYTTTRGDFDIAGTEIGSTGLWRASMVGSVGYRRWAWYLQVGGSPSHANDVKLLEGRGFWTGTTLWVQDGVLLAVEAGSVIGNVGGNVTGSIGSLAAQAKLDVNAEADAALADYDPPTKAEMDARTLASASYATATNLQTVDDNVDAILADTNELQTDWVNGGRLDNILDARASETSLNGVEDIVGTSGVKIAPDAITASTFDESTAFPVTSADTGNTTILRKGSGSITGTTLDTAISGISGAYVSDSGTAQAGAAGTITLRSGAVATDDYYNYQILTLTGNTGAGQARIISDYDGSTRVATVNGNWATPPDNTTTYTITAFGQIPGASAPTAGEVADEVRLELATELGRLDAAVSTRQTAIWAAANSTVNLSATTISTSQAVASVTGNVGGSVASVAGAVTVGTINNNVITANSIASNAITAAKFAAGALDAVWSVATRLLTAGTNIVLAKGTGVTGFNDLSAAAVNAEVDTALADYDPPTKAEMDARTLASASYATATALGDVPTNAEFAAAFPANFAAMGINASGHVSRVTLVDTTTDLTNGGSVSLDLQDVRDAMTLPATLSSQAGSIDYKLDNIVGGVSVVATFVDPDHTWWYQYPDDLTAANTLYELIAETGTAIGFNGLLAMDFDRPLPEGTSINRVNVVDIQPPGIVVTSTAVSADHKKAIIGISTTGTAFPEEGMYTAVISIITEDDQEITRQGRLFLRRAGS